MLKGSGTRKLGGRDSMRAIQRLLSLVVVVLFVSLFPSKAHAYAWMIKHGYSGCPVCHADPSGGELLTAYGRAQSELLLRMRYGKHSGDSSSSSSSSSSTSSAPAASTAAPSSGSTAAPAAAPAKGDSDADDKTDANSGEDEDDDDKPAPAAKAGGDAQANADAQAAGNGGPPAAAGSDESTSDDDELKASGFLWGLFKTPDWLLLGGSYRQLGVYKPNGVAGSGAVIRKGSFVTFPMQADAYGQISIGNFRVEGSLGIIRVGVGSPYGRAAQITDGQGDQWNLLSRTHWVGYDFDDGAFTLRAGHMNLPFGVRIPEHTMWVRMQTRTDRDTSQQDGVALAYNGEALRGEIMGIAGNYQVNPDKYRERGYSGYAEYMVTPKVALGASSLTTHAKEDRITLEPGVTRTVDGLFARAALSDITALLAEGDMLASTQHDIGYVGFAQLDFEVTQGLHLMATGEAVDNGYDRLKGGDRTLGNGQPALGGWATVDWFCFSHVEVRADVYDRQGDSLTALLQLHVFL